MILTVTPNAAVDKTYTVENFAIDRVHRPYEWRIVPGGKGINVARVYRELGGQAMATGFAGGHNGDYILEGLRSEGIPHEFVHSAGESRVCIAILDPISKTQTELNEVGPEISQQEVDLLKLKFETLVRDMKFAVFAGSAPPGIPDGMYRELIEIASHYGVKCVLDSSGASLREGLKAVPFMVKPNAHELSAVAGRQLDTLEEIAEVAKGIHESGVKIVATTLGRDGALLTTDDGALHAKPPEINFVSAVGSGDAFVAAFVYTMETGGSSAEALRLATGAGAANATSFGAGFCSKEDIYRLANDVEIVSL